MIILFIRRSIWVCFVKNIRSIITGQKFSFKNAKDKYRAGEKVTLYYWLIATDTDYSFSVDGAELSLGYDDNMGYVLSFIMPDHDVSVHCFSRNSMLRDGYYEED